MFSFIRNLRIGIRIALALTLPIIALLLFSGSMVIEKRQTASELESLQRLSSLAPGISALVHEMQKERGTSAGFVGSNGTKFVDKLPAQRQLTDQRRAAIAEAFEGFDASAYGAGVVNKIATARDALTRLDGTRRKVTDLTITVARMAKYYTATISGLLMIVEDMTVLSTDAAVTNAISAYTSFLQGKERAGIERAMGSVGFSAGKFAPPIYRRFLQLIAMQDTYLEIFAIQATEEQRKFLDSTVSGEAVEQVERMRKIAIDSLETGNTGGIEGPFWFDRVTEKINLMKTVEDRIANDLATLATDAYESANGTFRTLLAVTAVLLVITIGLAVIIARGITGPLTAMTGAMGRLAEGELETDIPAIGRRDEIGEMAGAVQIFKDNAVKVREMTREQEALSRRNRRAVQSEVMAINNAMDEEVRSAVSAVLEQSETMQSSAQGMAATAEETSRQSTAVAAAAEQAAANVQTVAAAAEELSSSISEISRQVTQSSQIANNAVHDAEQTNQQIQGLAAAASKIGEVVELITDIAERTNLLALNATIEAARAGDAGKGFAVVASEVKNLANQTAKATEEISGQIGGIQNATGDAVSAIDGIGKTIGEINEISSAIAAAVEEQGAATQEIARNVEQASAGTQEVSSNITGVTQAAGETGQSASRQLDMANSVADEVRQMQGRLTQITTDSANEQFTKRHTVNVGVEITADGVTTNCMMTDVSRGGAAIVDRALKGDRGTEFEIEVPDLGKLRGAIMVATGDATHVRFELDDDQMKALEGFVSSHLSRHSRTYAAA